jgi:hypothetical protein
MFEREIYTGEIRAVRRNGLRLRPGPTMIKLAPGRTFQGVCN